MDFPRSLPGKHCDIPWFLLPDVFIFKSIHFLESCQNCTALLELVLIIRVRTDPVRGILRVPELCMLTEAGNKSTHGLLPGMAHEPTRALRFCIGCHQLHQAAREAQCCWCDDPRAGVVEVEGLSIQWLFEVWASRVPGMLGRCAIQATTPATRATTQATPKPLPCTLESRHVSTQKCACSLMKPKITSSCCSLMPLYSVFGILSTRLPKAS